MLQVLVTPLSMGAAIFYTVSWAASGGRGRSWSRSSGRSLGRALRGLSHLRENPRDLAISPLMALVVAGHRAADQGLGRDDA